MPPVGVELPFHWPPNTSTSSWFLTSSPLLLRNPEPAPLFPESTANCSPTLFLLLGPTAFQCLLRGRWGCGFKTHLHRFVISEKDFPVLAQGFWLAPLGSWSSVCPRRAGKGLWSISLSDRFALMVGSEVGSISKGLGHRAGKTVVSPTPGTSAFFPRWLWAPTLGTAGNSDVYRASVH